jgi:hypothetical protein
MIFESSMDKSKVHRLDPTDSRVRESCTEGCIVNQYAETHSHFCDLSHAHMLINIERDIVNYLALKLQSVTGQAAIDQILEARITIQKK